MISVVVPIFNEEESLPSFFSRIKKIIPTLSKKYEYIFVDDGSTDASLKLLKNFVSNEKQARIFSFRKNLGKAEALNYGFYKAKGNVIVTLDADLQDKPEEISKLFTKLNEGFEMVSGWRKNRKDKFYKTLSSKLFNTTVRKMWGINIHDYNCGLKAYTSEAAKSLHLYGGMHRFIPLLAQEQGFKVSEVAIEHDIRRFGKSKYGFSKIFKDLPDMFTLLFLTRYGKRPMHFFSLIGSLFTVIGAIILIYFEILHTFYAKQVGDRPLLFIGMLLVIAGFQVALTGFLADLIVNIFLTETSSYKHIEQHIKYASKS